MLPLYVMNIFTIKSKKINIKLNYLFKTWKKNIGYICYGFYYCDCTFLNCIYWQWIHILHLYIWNSIIAPKMVKNKINNLISNY
jgi:hypothetical protein